MENRTFYITEEDEEERIDKYLSSISEEFSRSFIQRLIKEGAVLVNGTPVKANYRVAPGSEILLMLPDLTLPEALPEALPLDILYEDKDIIVVNKKKGMVVHPAQGHYTGTLVNALLFHCREELSGINGVLRPGIVHRIDMDTTGALVVCKNDSAHVKLASQLKAHSITRKYQAIVHGVIKEDSGTINAPIGRHPAKRKKMAVLAEGGRNAVTHYQVLARGSSYSYIECTLETGRTHQIRVHMASRHHPILGDSLYGPSKCPVNGLTGQTLHARTLGFVHPASNKYMEFEAPLPDYFKQLLDKYFTQDQAEP